MITLVNKDSRRRRKTEQFGTLRLGQTSSTVGEEKQYNSRLSKSREDFIRLMKELKLSYPNQIGRNWILHVDRTSLFRSFQIRLFQRIWCVVWYQNSDDDRN